ncbi:hypothetical protein PANT_7c00178 [Moesziomyces antarcticus T-34]|uniref:Uncharacterized protein n=1 Tax=Pseudozyma antarctica (strain T-34) TaxID=1151754 RepID=M9LZ98_PSEA3|nr:hypothetical protein PANT_7c00178 [Moesziomyces antarcticus T-34]
MFPRRHDFMVHTLMSATRLLDSSVPQTLTSNPAVEVENQRVTISPLSTRFGVNFKGQLAAVVLFTIADGDADAIRTGWSDVFQDRRERAPSPPSTLAAVTNVPGAESFSCLAQPCGRSQRHGQSPQNRSRSHDDVPTATFPRRRLPTLSPWRSRQLSQRPTDR